MNHLAAALALVAIAGFGSAAHAGGYVSAGIGADAGLSGEVAQHFTTDQNGSSGRVALGQRLGRFAIEVNLYGSDLQGITGLTGQQSYSSMTAGVNARYYVPLTGHLEAYGKAGLDKTWFVGNADKPATSYSGRGYDLGAGLQYTIHGLLLGELALWVDYTHQSFTLHDDVKRDLGGGAQLLSVGVSVGF